MFHLVKQTNYYIICSARVKYYRKRKRTHNKCN